MSRSIGELIEAADLNALLAVVDGLCGAREWDELVNLADMCEAAVDRGKQLWPIAAHIDYRIALEAPAEYAAGVLESVAARWAHGPLTEVAASTHTWAELAPHINDPVSAAYVAQERVLRGEDLRGDRRAHAEVLEMPLKLLGWEPAYPLATFGNDFVEVAEVDEPKVQMKQVGRTRVDELEDPELVGAMVDLVSPWTTESNGAARAVVVDGDGVAAASILTYDTLLIGPLTTAEAIQRIGWAAASGGALGRRRGAARGRQLMWQLGALLTDMEWPPSPEELGVAIAGLSWSRWDEGPPGEGWVLRFAVADDVSGWGAALSATDFLSTE